MIGVGEVFFFRKAFLLTKVMLLMILGVFGVILAVLGTVWVAFWVSWAAAGVYFGGQRVPLCASGAQLSPKTASPFRGPPVLSDFGSQREPKRLQKWS